MGEVITMRFRWLIALALSIASTAMAQDTLSLFPVGGEAKAHAGAGQVGSRGAAAASYNPANLAEGSAGVVADTAFDLATLHYSYAFPGYDAVEVDRVLPIPFAGISGRSKSSRLSFGVSLLPVPGAFIDESVNDLPTRQLGTYPVLIDVRMRGRGTGYRAAAGAAFSPFKNFSLGVSVLANRSESIVEARDESASEVIASESETSETRLAVVGVRAPLFTRRLSLVATMRTPATEHYQRETVLSRHAATAATEPGTKTGERRGPPIYGLGLAADAGRGFHPFAEGRYEPWSKVRQRDTVGLVEGEIAYHDVLELAAGSSFRLIGGDATVAYRSRGSHLGDGTMANLDNDEQIGMQFQNIEAMPTSTLAAGFGRGALDASVSYTRGSRDVGAAARGYGSYELEILSVGLGWRQSL
jgi:hypothetical protein